MRQLQEPRDTDTCGARPNSASTVEIDKVTDPGEIASWGVMSTPALVIDDDVVLSGRVPPADQIKQLLVAAR